MCKLQTRTYQLIETKHRIWCCIMPFHELWCSISWPACLANKHVADLYESCIFVNRLIKKLKASYETKYNPVYSKMKRKLSYIFTEQGGVLYDRESKRVYTVQSPHVCLGMLDVEQCRVIPLSWLYCMQQHLRKGSSRMGSKHTYLFSLFCWWAIEYVSTDWVRGQKRWCPRSTYLVVWEMSRVMVYHNRDYPNCTRRWKASTYRHVNWIIQFHRCVYFSNTS